MEEIKTYRDALGQILNGASSLGSGSCDPLEVMQGIQKIAAAALLNSPVPKIWEVNRLAESE